LAEFGIQVVLNVDAVNLYCAGIVDQTLYYRAASWTSVPELTV
jgi:hypothetical protein